MVLIVVSSFFFDMYYNVAVTGSIVESCKFVHNNIHLDWRNVYTCLYET